MCSLASSCHDIAFEVTLEEHNACSFSSIGSASDGSVSAMFRTTPRGGDDEADRAPPRQIYILSAEPPNFAVICCIHSSSSHSPASPPAGPLWILQPNGALLPSRLQRPPNIYATPPGTCLEAFYDRTGHLAL